MLGLLEYSDFPMDEATFGVGPGQHIPGEIVHSYLHQYARRFGVYDKIRFSTRVLSAESLRDEGWRLRTRSGSSSEAVESSLLTRKLIVATGLTSDPNMPKLPGSESFGSPLFHTRDFRQHATTLESVQNVVVLGGAKSAWDAVYLYASRGVHVDMVIRQSGKGPCWMSPPYVTPLKRWLEKLVFTRLLTWFSPCIWGDADGYGFARQFLHGTAIGRWLTQSFWATLGRDVLALNGYDKHPETDIAKLKPWTDVFYVGTALGILNYPTNFYDYVKNGTVRVHIDEISHLSPKTVNLTSGPVLHADALVCATGWNHSPPLEFLPAGIADELGLPYNLSATQRDLVDKADNEIMARFPSLRAQPPYSAVSVKAGDVEVRPFRLYRFMVPPATMHAHNIGFVGAMSTLSNSMVAQTQALWLASYLSGRLSPLESKTCAEIEYETVLQSEFGKWRTPAGYGDRFPDIVFDTMPYIDLMLEELGLEKRRKGGWREWLEGYGPDDYRGLVEEWMSTTISRTKPDETRTKQA